MMRSHDRQAAEDRCVGASRRMRREGRTVRLMIEMYCAHHHDGEGRSRAAATSVDSGSDAAPLCPSCAELVDYSLLRIDNCSFGEHKPTCARCTVHCFRPARREKIRVVMRYAGPRMTLRHPYLALRHLLDRRRTPQEG